MRRNSFKIRLQALRQWEEQEREQFSLIYFSPSRCYFIKMNGAESVKIERFDSKRHEMFMDFAFYSLYHTIIHDAIYLTA